MMRSALASLGALLALAACGGAATQPVPGIPSAARVHTAKSRALVYVSDLLHDEVFVYTFPQLRPAGTLTGFSRLEGLCGDAAGNVWVMDAGTRTLYKFKHAGISPVAAVRDPGGVPFSCAVNPSDGDLAVSNASTGDGRGNIAIFNHAHRDAQIYRPQPGGIYYFKFASYDASGNLWVDGVDRHGGFAYAELAAGQKKLTSAELTGSPIQSPGGVMYALGSVAIADAGATAAIYQTSGSSVTGTTPLLDACAVQQFFVTERVVAVASTCPGSGELQVYDYPAGGKAKNQIGVSEPVGVTISN
jgi:hypothetical protein